MLQLGEGVKLRNCRLVHEKDNKTDVNYIGIETVVLVSITNILGSLVTLVIIVVINDVTDAHCSSSMPGMKITILVLVNETGSGVLDVEMAEMNS